MLDVVSFVRRRQRLGLWVILRPSPYAFMRNGISEACLLASAEEMDPETSDERYLRHGDYYDRLMPLGLRCRFRSIRADRCSCSRWKMEYGPSGY